MIRIILVLSMVIVITIWFTLDYDSSVMYAYPQETPNVNPQCLISGTFLKFDNTESIKITEYTIIAENNSLIVTKSIDEHSPPLEESMDNATNLSNGILFSCFFSDNVINYQTIEKFNQVSIKSIRQKVTESYGVEEITFQTTKILKPFDENDLQKSGEIRIPEWVKSQGKWWVSNSISDAEFINAIEFLISEGIIIIHQDQAIELENHKDIPDWIRKTVNWWSENQISDQEMANALQFLIKNGVIRI